MSTVMVMMIDCEVLMYFDQISNRRFLSVSLLQNCYFPPSWAPQARSDAWEVYPWELWVHPSDDPPRPSRPKAGLGLVMIMMMMTMMAVMMMMTMMMMMMIMGLQSSVITTVNWSWLRTEIDRHLPSIWQLSSWQKNCKICQLSSWQKFLQKIDN